MSFVSRDWQCQNKRCHAQFHSYEPHPECPKCGCVRVSWVPGGGHISNVKGLDASLNALAKNYGMGDINSASPSRLNRSMPKHPMPKADGPMWRYAPGFTAPFNMQSNPTCEPSRERVNFKVTQAAGRHVGGATQMRTGPAITAGTPMAAAAILRGGKKPATA